jgi:hypothetical protein
MGLRIEFAPHLIKLMNPQDQALYGGAPGVHPPYQEDHHAPVKTSKLERDEQGHFWNWLCFNGYADGTIWHRTDKRSTGTLGTPDFVVPIWGGVLYVEFKMAGNFLSPAQEKFQQGLEAKGHTIYVCYSCAEAIALVKQKDRLL